MCISLSFWCVRKNVLIFDRNTEKGSEHPSNIRISCEFIDLNQQLRFAHPYDGKAKTKQNSQCTHIKCISYNWMIWNELTLIVDTNKNMAKLAHNLNQLFIYTVFIWIIFANREKIKNKIEFELNNRWYEKRISIFSYEKTKTKTNKIKTMKKL